mgnify:CR=1 FL=1
MPVQDRFWFSKQRMEISETGFQVGWADVGEFDIVEFDIGMYTTGRYLKFKEWENNMVSYVPYINELKKYIFKFKDVYLSKAIDILSNYGYKENQTTFISIHARLTDYRSVLDGLQPINGKYFSRAMDYFHKKYSVSRAQHYYVADY